MSTIERSIIKLFHVLEGGHWPVTGFQSSSNPVLRFCNGYFGKMPSLNSCTIAKISPWLEMRLKWVHFIYVRHKIVTKGWLKFAYLLSFLLFSVRIIPLDPCIWPFCRQWFMNCSPFQELHIKLNFHPLDLFHPAQTRKWSGFILILPQGPGFRLGQLNREWFFYISFRNIQRKWAGRNLRARPHLKLGKSHLSTSLCLYLEQQH